MDIFLGAFRRGLHFRGFCGPKLVRTPLYASPEMLEQEISSRYSGKLAIGRGLDVF